MRLWELRREPHKNVKEGTIKKLLPYASDRSMCVSFSPLRKIGVNPQSDWDTPNGVYAYQLQQYKASLESNADVSKVFPYGTERPYLFVLKITASNALDFDKQLSDSEFEKCKAVFNTIVDTNGKVLGSYSDFDNMIETLNVKRRYPSNSQQVYYAFRKAVLTHHINTNDFNKYLRECGFDCVIDNGHGVLHSGLEPIQVCFLVPSSYEIIDLVHNDSLHREDRHMAYGRHGKRRI